MRAQERDLGGLVQRLLVQLTWILEYSACSPTGKETELMAIWLGEDTGLASSGRDLVDRLRALSTAARFISPDHEDIEGTEERNNTRRNYRFFTLTRTELLR